MRVNVRASECEIECDVLELACLRACARRLFGRRAARGGEVAPAIGIREVRKAALAAILSFCERGRRNPNGRRSAR